MQSPTPCHPDAKRRTDAIPDPLSPDAKRRTDAIPDKTAKIRRDKTRTTTRFFGLPERVVSEFAFTFFASL